MGKNAHGKHDNHQLADENLNLNEATQNLTTNVKVNFKSINVQEGSKLKNFMVTPVSN